MQKPLVNNRRLNEKWSAQTNELMIKKLQGAKPQINSRCPESFFFYKTQFKKPNLLTNKLAKFEIAKNNENLLRKLLDVNIERNTKSNKVRQPVFTFKKNFLTGNKKYDIIKIAQENQSMLKRLNERSSFYDVHKWEKDYQMNQYYKRNHCMFPSIDFKKSNSGLFNSTVKSSPGQSDPEGLTVEKRKYNNSCSNFNQIDPYQQEENNEKSNYIQINEDSQDKDYPKVLFKTQVYLGTLGSCLIDFVVQIQNFTIKIESVYEKERNYGIIFDSRKCKPRFINASLYSAVENIQKYYKKYEEMIKELEYDEKNDVVKFNNSTKKELICRCVKLPPKNPISKDQQEETATKEQLKGDNHDCNSDQKGINKENEIEKSHPKIKTEDDNVINKNTQEIKSASDSNKKNEEIVLQYSDQVEQINKDGVDSHPVVEDISNKDNNDLVRKEKDNEEKDNESNQIIKEKENSPDEANKIERNEEKKEKVNERTEEVEDNGIEEVIQKEN